MTPFLLLVMTLTPLFSGQGNPVIVVGAKTFTESAILQELMAQTLEEHAGLTVKRQQFQGTKICFDALRMGNIHLYAEYTGTGLRDILGDSSAVATAADAYARVRIAFLRDHDLEWGSPFGLNNTYVLIMRVERAQELGIETISQLARQDLRFGVSHEFLERPDGIPGLEKKYGFKISSPRGMTHDLAYGALERGDIDVMDGYSTDGRLKDPEILFIEDDRHFFPPYEAAPLMHAVLHENREARMALSLLSGRLDDQTIRDLNYEVDVNHRDHVEVVREFLNRAGLSQVEARAGGVERSLLEFLWDRRTITLELIQQHLLLTCVAVVLACLLGVPLGVYAGRRPALAAGVLGFAGVLQTIPSIALLAFMLPLFGVGAKPAIAALFLYGLLPILRNTVTGIQGIDPRLREAGLGLGMTGSQLLWMVELPLSVPVILAGIRTCAVISIGTATLAAFIGAGGLGDPIVTGLARSQSNLVLAGAIPAALLAIVVDMILALLERTLTPRGLGPSRG